MSDTSQPHVGDEVTLPQTPYNNGGTYIISFVEQAGDRWYIKVEGLNWTFDWTALQNTSGSQSE